MEEKQRESMVIRFNAKPKWFFPFLRKEKRLKMRALFEGETGAFIKEVEVKRRWHEVN